MWIAFVQSGLYGLNRFNTEDKLENYLTVSAVCEEFLSENKSISDIKSVIESCSKLSDSAMFLVWLLQWVKQVAVSTNCLDFFLSYTTPIQTIPDYR